MGQVLLEEVRENNRLLRALLALYVKDYEKRPGGEDKQRVELLLAAAGLGYQDIALLLNKKPDAVRMLIKRNS